MQPAQRGLRRLLRQRLQLPHRPVRHRCDEATPFSSPVPPHHHPAQAFSRDHAPPRSSLTVRACARAGALVCNSNDITGDITNVCAPFPTPPPPTPPPPTPPPPTPPPPTPTPPSSPPPSSPCVPYSPTELETEQNKCATEFELGKKSCTGTKAEKKACKQANQQIGIACDRALYCPPVGTKSPP